MKIFDKETYQVKSCEICKNNTPSRNQSKSLLSNSDNLEQNAFSFINIFDSELNKLQKIDTDIEKI